MAHNQTNRRAACSVVTIPDPDNWASNNHAEVGGTLEIRCESPSYPTFKVIFDGDTPSDQGHEFHGGIHHPVVIPLTKVGEFDYTVVSFSVHGGEPFIWGNKSRVLPCPGCRPLNLGPPPTPPPPPPPPPTER